MKRILLITIFITIFSFLFSAEVNVQFNLTQNFFNVFLPSYVDPDHLENQPVFFNCVISSDEDVQKYTINVELEWNGATLIGDGDLIAEAKNPLTVQNPLMFTNKDVFMDGENELFDSNFDFDNIRNNNQDFEDVVLETGRFPDGRYVFRFDVYDVENGNTILASGRDSFTIISPFSLELVSPGASTSRTIEQINTPNPTFIWVSNLASYNVYLYEVDSRNVSLDEVMNMTPIYEIINHTSPVFTYSSASTPLEENQLYAWRVEGNIITPIEGTQEKVFSDINIFEIVQNADGNAESQQLLDLIGMLPAEQLQGLIDLIQQGYVPTGNYEINGETVSGTEVYTFLNSLLNGRKSIKSVEVE